MTDVTGFGLLGHLLEVCKASNLRNKLSLIRFLLFKNPLMLQKMEVSTGASKRNWNSYSKFIQAINIKTWQRNLLTDLQTSGGLLITFTEKIRIKF